MNALRLAAAALPLAAAVPSAPAQEMRPVLTAASAQTIVSACAAYAGERKWALAITVLDAGGNLMAFQRMDGSRLASVDISKWKADAAASWGWPTKQMVDRIATLPSFAQAPHVATFEGGVPIYSADGKVLLGAGGASGATGAEDAECIRAGIARAGLKDAKAE